MRLWLSGRRVFRYILNMSLAEVEKEALALNDLDRARLMAALIETLPADFEVSDEEVLQRDAELSSGQTEEISHDEFVKRVEAERRR